MILEKFQMTSLNCHTNIRNEVTEKFGEKPDVCNAIGAHHDEVEMTSMISPIVQVCDAISGARPGAVERLLSLILSELKS